MGLHHLPKLIAIVGPTASGKSELALQVAQKFGADLISNDSVQVYRRFDIGSCKPSIDDQQRIVHHQIDCINPDQLYSAADYEHDTLGLIESMQAAGRLPVLVGGSGLYLQAVLFGMVATPAIPLEVKQQVEAWHQQGTNFCHAQLEQLDLAAAKRLHPNDTTRVLRALEVCLASGNSLLHYQHLSPKTMPPSINQSTPNTTHNSASGHSPRFNALCLGWQWERQALYQRINERTQRLIQQGWLQETQALLHDYSASLKPLRSIGYHQLVEHLQGVRDFDSSVELIKQKTRNYAKRQLTWFNNKLNTRWFAATDTEAIFDEISRFLES